MSGKKKILLLVITAAIVAAVIYFVMQKTSLLSGDSPEDDAVYQGLIAIIEKYDAGSLAWATQYMAEYDTGLTHTQYELLGGRRTKAGDLVGTYGRVYDSNFKKNVAFKDEFFEYWNNARTQAELRRLKS